MGVQVGKGLGSQVSLRSEPREARVSEWLRQGKEPECQRKARETGWPVRVLVSLWFCPWCVGTVTVNLGRVPGGDKADLGTEETGLRQEGSS